MATTKKLTDNHLTCVICTEVFTHPATLHCNHTFCKSCLLKYTNTQPEAVQAKSIPCPSCRQLTKVTTPDSPVEEWVSQLKPSHVIQGLMDDFGPGTEPGDVDNCSVCKTQGKTTPASSWCSVCDDIFCDGCLKMHNMMPILRDHELVDLSDTTKRKTKQRLMCTIHKGEQIMFFCKDCTIAICHICCSIKHRKCDDVDTLDNMTPVVREHLSNQNQELKIKMTTSENEIIFKKSEIEEIKTNAQSIRNEIRKLRQTVVEVILRKEKQLLDKVDRSTDEQLQKLQAQITSQEIQLQMYQQQYEFTANAVASNCEMDMYAVYELMGEMTDNRNRDNQPAPGRVVFTHDMDNLSKALDELELGDVEVVGAVSVRQSTLFYITLLTVRQMMTVKILICMTSQC
ncbi:E3 ubiquitin-protein ligase TRIM56-like isoform X3 [Haliotis rubra]|uniref:E3 ubiquitin-protein ligase TRIM56-like isoform X3 n=1 Tax=Haliotis rubra TaxID=36100 RepID=UPI001EE5228F|nr:E3 ubiquitin-protein ligase TRIM56-like isoform X3 [Haliotis rubra]